MRARWLSGAPRCAPCCAAAFRGAVLCAAVLCAALLGFAAHADTATRLVFGSFESRANAERWAVEVTSRTGMTTQVLELPQRFRVVTEPLTSERLADAIELARREAFDFWQLDDTLPDASATSGGNAVAAAPEEPAPLVVPPSQPPSAPTPSAPTPSAPTPSAPTPSAPTPADHPARPALPHPLTGARLPDNASATARPERGEPTSEMDLDLGFQTRSYAERGLDGQSRFQPSVSAQYRYRRSWSESDSVTFTPFVRIDAEDDERTHADLRELYWSHVGEDWDLHVGVRQVFWGVTEFKHLVDVINQTDLVENIDGEDKLGQPMVNLSMVSDWGIIDLFVLPGFRERTFPGEDGRLRYAFPVDEDDATYESGAGRDHVDGAVRWSYVAGPLEFSVYQFSGVSREPKLIPVATPGGDVVLRPSYDLIDQTGVDAQAILGDWALKLEALSRSGYGERYGSAVAGFERTFVGVWGRTDIGLVAEYMYDERGDDAWDTVLERDLAVGTRWRLNDVADSQALIGVIWDTKTDEYLVTLEASRRLGDAWALLLEGRVFGGADDDLGPGDPHAKTASLQRDDYVQLELTRFF